MYTSSAQQIAVFENVPALTAIIGTREKIRPTFSFDPEFSLPPYFFDKDFLDNANLCEPQIKEKCKPIRIRCASGSGCTVNRRNTSVDPTAWVTVLR